MPASVTRWRSFSATRSGGDLASLHIIEREPRYVIQRLTGYTGSVPSGSERHKQLTTFYILDLAYNARVVHKVDAHPREDKFATARAKRKAERICRSMNRDYDHSLPDAG